MPDPLPIACSLDAAPYAERLAAIREIGEMALVRTRHHARGSGADLFFRDDDEISRRLRAVVEAESKCCAFLDLELDRDEGTLRLSISGPAGAAPVVNDLVRSFEPGP